MSLSTCIYNKLLHYSICPLCINKIEGTTSMQERGGRRGKYIEWRVLRGISIEDVAFMEEINHRRGVTMDAEFGVGPI